MAAIVHGTAAWFEMVGQRMACAAAQAALPADLTVSFLETYVDGEVGPDGLRQGIRFDIVRGQPSWRVGARPGERADIQVEITTGAARRLNRLRAADPAFAAEQDRVLGSGEMKVEGDLARLGGWLASVHDDIVDRTL